MTEDRKVTVNEADLRAVLLGVIGRDKVRGRLNAALDALGPEPCDHPSVEGTLSKDSPTLFAPQFRCIAPKGHHDPAYNEFDPCCDRCNKDDDDPIHCGDKHVPPAEVWSTE